jgi:hypothetical protein
MKKSKYRRVKLYAVISPPHEGSNIYMPGGYMGIYGSVQEAVEEGADYDEIVPCTVSYPIRKPKK